MTTAFEKLFKAYCSKKALDASTLVFITSEGQRILGHQTPADVRYTSSSCTKRSSQSSVDSLSEIITILICPVQVAVLQVLMHQSARLYPECTHQLMAVFQQDFVLLQFNMEDGDQIEVQQHQIGGC
jgi:hypothetical protein